MLIFGPDWDWTAHVHGRRAGALQPAERGRIRGLYFHISRGQSRRTQVQPRIGHSGHPQHTETANVQVSQGNQSSWVLWPIFKFYQKIVILICCFQNFVLIHVIHNEWKQTSPQREILSCFLYLKTKSLYDVWVKKYLCLYIMFINEMRRGKKMSKKLTLLISHFLPPQ